MSKVPQRRRGQRAAGARVRQIPVEAHEGTPEMFLRRHELEACEAVRDKALRHQLMPKLLDRIADPRNLKLALDYLARRGDRRVQRLDHDERWELARVIGRTMLDESYRPGRGYTRKEPKSSGKGTRTLTVPDYIDRMVERAAVQILQPLLDLLFFETSLGYRPEKGRSHALALVERLAYAEERWVWIAEDLQGAFDTVPQRRLFDVVRHYLPNDGIARLVRLLVVTRSGKGLKQGGPLSPLLLNLYLHHLLDRRCRKSCPTTPLIRVADDLLLLCRTVADASEVYSALYRHVQECGMRLKGSPQTATHNLRVHETVEWLGYRFRLNDNQLQVTMTDRMWRSLERRFESCHEKPDPPIRAVEALRGWIGQLGPVYPSSDYRPVYARIMRIAATHSFEELPVFEEALEWWENAHSKWERRRNRTDTTRLSRGSARAEASWVDFGPTPGGPSERDSPPETSSSNNYRLATAGSCPVDGDCGTWEYRLSDEDGTAVQSRSGSSPHTTRERMELLAVLRGLEAVPRGSHVNLLVADGKVAAGIATLSRRGETNEGADIGGPDHQTSDLWVRLAAALSAHEIVVANTAGPSKRDARVVVETECGIPRPGRNHTHYGGYA